MDVAPQSHQISACQRLDSAAFIKPWTKDVIYDPQCFSPEKLVINRLKTKTRMPPTDKTSIGDNSSVDEPEKALLRLG